MKRVLLFVARGTEVFEMAAFFDVLGWASTVGSEAIEVVVAGLEEEIRCSFGLRVRTDIRPDEVRAADFDALAIPGGFEEHGFYQHAYSDAVADLIRDFEKNGKIIASICVGALAVASSGVLAGRTATTYGIEGVRKEQLAGFDVTVVDQPIVADRRIITSTSPATAVDVALLLVERLTNRANANETRRLMGF